MRVAWDTENSGLLNESTIDYTCRPYRLRDDFKIHYISCRDLDSDNVYRFVGDEVYTKFPEFAKGVTQWVGANSINYDHLVLKLKLNLEYTIGPDTLDNKPVQIDDIMVLSKTLNPDRPGHSIEYFGKILGFPKIDWRAEAISLGLIKHNDPAGAEFLVYHPRMGEYCDQDTLITKKAYEYLLKEWGDWNWESAYQLEKAVAEIITRQEHRGFKFDTDLAKRNVEEIDKLMEDIRQRVEPSLPPKKATKGLQKEYTPPATQFLKNGQPSTYIKNFAERIGAKIEGDVDSGYKFLWNGLEKALPLAQEPLITEAKMTLADSTEIKEYLVREFNWQPTAFKERDLTVDSKKKKITKEKFKAAVEKYVTQTLESAFCKHRCDHLGVKPEQLLNKLLSHDMKKPLKVLTNPSFTVGQEKQLCQGLERIAESYPHAQDIAYWLTYRHRRNSILGGGADPDEDEAEKGFLSNVREDGRIPTPADTCGCNTSRMKHRVVANIPRASSLYGGNMRAMFGVDLEQCYQLGYDADGLEARIEGHYVWKYPGGPEYAEALVAPKPNDIHTVTAAKIGIPRVDSKTLKYACVPVNNTQVLTESGWKWYSELKEGDSVLTYNPQKDCIERDVILKLHYFENEEIIKFSNKYDSFECTLDHRWYGWKRRQKGHRGPRYKEYGFFTSEEITQENNILVSAEYEGGSSKVTPSEAALVAWLLSDGQYKWSEKGEGTSCSNGTRKFISGRISQANHKFHCEIRDIIRQNNIQFEEYLLPMENGNDVFTFVLSSPDLRVFMDRVVPGRTNKHDYNWVEWVLGLNKESLDSFVHNFWLADGDSKGNENKSYKVITQNEGNILNGISLAIFLQGKKVTIGNKGIGACKQVRSQSKRHITCQELDRTSIGQREVFCLTTSNGTFIIKQPEYMGITGNCSYGAQPPKIAKQMGWPLSKAKRVFNDFWEAAKPLEMLKTNLEKYWETVGKKQFILGLDGRKVPTRSKHSLLNSLFQSAGLICMKRAMVIHDRMLKKEGLSIDFFRETW